MQSWHPSLDPAQSPLYLAIADAIARAVAEGELRPGAQLPTHRQLAARLGVDVTTVSRAYAEAQRRRLLSAGVGRGTFVREAPSQAGEQRAMVDLGMNLPPLPADPSLRRMLQNGLAGLLRQSDMGALMAYHVGAGSAADCEAAAAWLHPVLGAVDPARLLVCAGAQAALTALLTLLARPGDTILTEELTYPGLRALAAQLGLRLLGVASDAEGLLPDEVDRACREAAPRAAPRAIYCIPTMQNPTTVTMPLDRRRALAAVAQRHGVPVIEDDAYGLLPTAKLRAITAEGAGYTIATMAKCLSPGLRIAYVAAPDPAAAAALATALRATSLMPSPVMLGLVTGWLADGTAVAYRDAVRAEAASRQLLAAEILDGCTLRAHPEGLHAWLVLPMGWAARDFHARLHHQGLAVVPAEAFRAGPAPAPNAVRLSLGAAVNRAVLTQALHIVAATLRQPGAPDAAGIV